jgi:hypothetical protein
MLPPEPNSLTLKLEMLRLSETSQQTKYIKWYENPKYDGCLNNKRHKDKKYICVGKVLTHPIFTYLKIIMIAS